MGWERKRGKIEEFNRLLRGASDTSFSVQVGDLDILPSVRYCITLDTDTRLPRDAAKELVGIISHPLNVPRFDARVGRVTDGYGILQPRVSVTMASAAGSLFARTYAGHTGVDPYTTAVSDVYQDLFDEGIFTGKGLYDVDAFVASLEGRVPENALLSHDLFEGLYARTALVTDVEVVDDYPSSVLAHARRQHRWVRGDWQILWWLFPFVPSRTGLQRNRLPLISRWKILDNLRRSLMAPATVAVLLLGWTVLPGTPAVWTAIGLAAVALPVGLRLLQLLSGPTRLESGSVFLRATIDDLNTDARPRLPAADVPRESGLRDAARDHGDARASRDHEAATPRVGDGRGQRPPWRTAAPGRVREGHDREPARSRSAAWPSSSWSVRTHCPRRSRSSRCGRRRRSSRTRSAAPCRRGARRSAQRTASFSSRWRRRRGGTSRRSSDRRITPFRPTTSRSSRH